MADPVLHIKDSYYFEVPKILCPSSFTKRQDFPEVWAKLDPEFQEWEFDRPNGEFGKGLYQHLTSDSLNVKLPPKEVLRDEWHHWVHADHANFAKPFDEFLEEKYQAHVAAFNGWRQKQVEVAQTANDRAALTSARALTLGDYLKSDEAIEKPYADFSTKRVTPEFQSKWLVARRDAGNFEFWKDDKKSVADWSEAKLAAYNGHLSGKILIRQPFAELRNMYEKESGFAISKFLIIEIFVALVVILIFSQLARKVSGGQPVKGKLWNLLETFLVFIRDQIARPVFGSHDHGHEDHGHDDKHAAKGGHGHGEHHAPAKHVDPAARFVPLLWTMFFFVLGCNLMGMVPWAGSPTAAFAVTFALACITFGTVIIAGMLQFGVIGFFLNQIPGMDLPWYMAIVIKPMILVIELAGLCIKHGVLAVRLLANMVAGHLVILGIMGLAFGAEAALQFTAPGVAGWQWWLTAAIAVFASAAFNILELFVAFLQAYILTFLSALFIGAAIHKH